MKKYIVLLAFLISCINITYSQSTVKLSSTFINDSLILGEPIRHIHYTEEYGDSNAISIDVNDSTIHLYPKKKDLSIELEELDIKFTQFRLNLEDSILYIKGTINNIDIENRLPYKNVLIFVCNENVLVKEDYSYALKTSVAGYNAYEVKDTSYYYSVYSYQLDYARKLRNSNPPQQQFECNFNLTNQRMILVFGRYGYRLKAFDLAGKLN